MYLLVNGLPKSLKNGFWVMGSSKGWSLTRLQGTPAAPFWEMKRD